MVLPLQEKRLKLQAISILKREDVEKNWNSGELSEGKEFNSRFQ